MFKQDPPKTMRTPLEKSHLPELDDNELLNEESIQHYCTMIGQLQWLVTLGRFDINARVTTMSRFRSAPRKGHLERLQKIYGNVLKTKHFLTRYRTKEPDYSYLPNLKHDWSYTVYGNCSDIRNIAVTSPVPAGLRNCYLRIPSTTNNFINNQDPKFSAPPKDYTNIKTLLDSKLRTQDRKQAQTPVGTSSGLFHKPRDGKVIIPN